MNMRAMGSFVILYLVFCVSIHIYMPYKRIIVNPTPETIQDAIYLDDVGVCYKYTQKKHECTDSIEYKENIHMIPEE